MPKELFIPDNATSSGMNITWTPTAQRLDISGWYDSYVGIPGQSFSLGEFFSKLGITEKDCQRAFK